MSRFVTNLSQEALCLLLTSLFANAVFLLYSILSSTFFVANNCLHYVFFISMNSFIWSSLIFK